MLMDIGLSIPVSYTFCDVIENVPATYTCKRRDGKHYKSLNIIWQPILEWIEWDGCYPLLIPNM